MNILFLSISDASGHKSAMDAVMKALKSIENHINVMGLNFFNYLPKKLVKKIDNAYYSMIETKPGLWTYLRKKKLVRFILKPFEILFCIIVALFFFKNVLKKKKFDAIVCTHSFPCVCINLLKKLKIIKSNLFAIITDYSINSFWINKNVDYYIIPHKNLEYGLIKNNIPQKKIKILGIPIDAKFNMPLNKQELYDKYKIPLDKTIILIMGGSLGLGRIEECVSDLIENPDLFIIIVCGKNKILENNLCDNYLGCPNLSILGYVNNVHELMELADCLICKPGGLTIAEALAKNINIITISPIPGQEEENNKFLLENNLAVYAKDTTKINDILKTLPDKDKKISEHAYPNSALDIANLILRGRSCLS